MGRGRNQCQCDCAGLHGDGQYGGPPARSGFFAADSGTNSRWPLGTPLRLERSCDLPRLAGQRLYAWPHSCGRWRMVESLMADRARRPGSPTGIQTRSTTSCRRSLRIVFYNVGASLSCWWMSATSNSHLQGDDIESNSERKCEEMYR